MNSEIRRHNGQVLDVRIDVSPNELGALVSLLEAQRFHAGANLTTFEDMVIDDLADLLYEVRES